MTHTCDARVLDLSGARALFTDVSDGNLALHVNDDPQVVAANRAALEAKIGRRLVFANQVHSPDVVTIDSDESLARVMSEAPNADAFVTNRGDIALAMMVADCVPVVLADSRARVVGAAHAGRRGLLDGVLANTVAAMVRLGAEPAWIVVAVGPSVCGRCYEVPEQMRQESVRVLSSVDSTTSWGTPALDLRAGCVEALVAAGLSPANITRIDRCTLENEDLFSYRRDAKTGRFAGVVFNGNTN